MDVPEDKALELTISPEMLSGLLNTFMRSAGGGQERAEDMNMSMALGNLLTNGQLKLNVNLSLNLNNPESVPVGEQTTVDPISYPNVTYEQKPFTTLGGPYTFNLIPGVSTYNFTVIGGGGGGGGVGGGSGGRNSGTSSAR